MKKQYYLLLFILLPILGHGQSYDLAMGLRLGTDWGLSIQQRVAKKTTIEAILQNSFRREEAMFTILGEQHLPFITRRFNLYTGGGIHAGWNQGAKDVNYKAPLGISIIAGLEFTLGNLNLSYDIKPAINLRGGEQFMYIQSGLTARYVILKRNALGLDNKKKRQRQRERKRKKNEEDWKFWKNW
jgi:hypothetical protein